jgi:D-sedoheptulose 7-phosphate isomerase
MRDIEQIKSYLYASVIPTMQIINDPKLLEQIEEAADWLASPIFWDKKLICIGNGGSMSDAAHFASELTGKYRFERPGYAAVVPDITYLTCAGNDFGYDRVFARYVEAVGCSGDTLLALTTSGKSQNVLNAIRAAAIQGMRVVLITGQVAEAIVRGGPILHIQVPTQVTNHAQELTMKLLHCLVELIEQRLTKPSLYDNANNNGNGQGHEDQRHPEPNGESVDGAQE